MHIDHSKLIELLVETSGIDKDKIESQLTDLVKEINEAIEEGEAYEVDGFGVFSAIGNNVVFIPANELATEINYKYVGMEAIEMDEATDAIEEPDAQDEDDPFAGLLDDEAEEITSPTTATASSAEPDSEIEEDETESPFGFEGQGEEPEEKPGPDKWGIDTYKDEGAESMFSGLLGDAPDEETEQEEDHFKAVFDQEDDENEDLERISEIEKELSGETDEENSDDEDTEADPFSALADESNEEDELEKALESRISDNDGEEEDDLEEALSASISEENPEDDGEPVPVIKNLTSEKTEKEEKPQKEEQNKNKKRKPFKRPQKAKKSGSQSSILYIIILIIVLGSGIYGLGYFGVVNIPGITPAEIPSTAQTTPPAPVPEVIEPTQTETPAQAQNTEQPITSAEMEQEPETSVSETENTQEQVVSSEASYGITGSVNDAANDGYTIVVYSLTNEDNARSKVTELSDQGYRVLLASIPHQQYGTLWRVSLGQFETMRDAALEAQDLGDPFTDNYFVTQIQ